MSVTLFPLATTALQCNHLCMMKRETEPHYLFWAFFFVFWKKQQVLTELSQPGYFIKSGARSLCQSWSFQTLILALNYASDITGDLNCLVLKEADL